MKFLLDHDVPIDISYSLVELGHEVSRLPQALDPTSTDQAVFDYACRKGFVIISCNRDDFLELAQGKPHCGIIILIRRKNRAAERAALIGLIQKAGEQGIAGNINFA